MITLEALRAEFQYLMQYESAWRPITDAEQDAYLNRAYQELAYWSYALTTLWGAPAQGPARYPFMTLQTVGSNAVWEWDCQPIGLVQPFHLMWASGDLKVSLRPSLYLRPEMVLRDAQNQPRAPSPITEYPASVPRVRTLPENKLVQALGDYPYEYLFWNGRLILRPPVAIESGTGILWIYGVFVPESDPNAPFPLLQNPTDACLLPTTLAMAVPEVAYFYYARPVTDLYPMVVQRYQRAIEQALGFRQAFAQALVTGSPIEEPSGSGSNPRGGRRSSG